MSDEAYDYGELLVIRHEDDVDLANLRASLDGRAERRPWRLLDLGAGDAVPDALDPAVRGVLVLGGTMGVPDDERPDWMEPELELLRRAVDAAVPVFGICLGAQLLATAMGGTVERRDTPQVGTLALTRTLGAQDDEVFAGWPDGAEALFCHEDQITSLPDGAVEMLDGSDGWAAWSLADGRSYGVQFHPEASAETVRTWIDHGLDRLVEAAGVDPAAFTDEVAHREPFLRANGVSLVLRWVDGVVGADDPTPRKHRR